MDEEPFVLERLHPQRRWRLNKGFLYLAGVCAIGFAAAYLFMPKKPEPPIPNAPSRIQEGLKMGETAFEPVTGPGRFIVGSIRNETGGRQVNVSIVFRLGTATEMDTGEVSVLIPVLEAGGAAGFRAGPIPEQADRWVVVSLRSLQ